MSPPTLQQILLVGLGGFFGSAARFVVSAWTARLVTAQFPLGTAIVNVLGCFAIGLLGGWASSGGAGVGSGQSPLSPTARLLLMTGALGGFTTFSAFAYETLSLSDAGSLGRAMINVAAQVTLGLGAAWLGLTITRT